MIDKTDKAPENTTGSSEGDPYDRRTVNAALSIVVGLAHQVDQQVEELRGAQDVTLRPEIQAAQNKQACRLVGMQEALRATVEAILKMLPKEK